jgi:predicted transcriptional regulator
MQGFSKESSIHPEPSVADILSCISHPKALLLFKAVAISDNDCSRILITKLGLSRRHYYSSMEKLMHTGLVRRIGGKHSLTSLGKVMFSCMLKIEMSIKYYWELKAIDSIRTSADVKGLPAKEYEMIVKNLIDSDEINNVAQQELVKH